MSLPFLATSESLGWVLAAFLLNFAGFRCICWIMRVEPVSVPWFPDSSVVPGQYFKL